MRGGTEDQEDQGVKEDTLVILAKQDLKAGLATMAAEVDVVERVLKVQGVIRVSQDTEERRARQEIQDPEEIKDREAEMDHRVTEARKDRKERKVV